MQIQAEAVQSVSAPLTLGARLLVVLLVGVAYTAVFKGLKEAIGADTVFEYGLLVIMAAICTAICAVAVFCVMLAINWVVTGK